MKEFIFRSPGIFFTDNPSPDKVRMRKIMLDAEEANRHAYNLVLLEYLIG